MRSIFAGAKNVAEQNTIKGVSPTGVLRSPSRRKAAKQLQSCYVKVGRTPYYFYFIFLIA
jgi:hypothetical protein